MLQPLSDYIFLEVEKAKKTEGGIILSESVRSKPAKAKVVAVGPGRIDRHGNFAKMSLRKGDVIVIDPFLPREIKVDGKDYLIMRESEVFAVQK